MFIDFCGSRKLFFWDRLECFSISKSSRRKGHSTSPMFFFQLTGVRLLWDGVSFLEMTVPPKYRNRLCGLCGNFNGDPSDDFFGRKKHQYGTGQQFGASWRVGGYRACSIQPKDMPKSYEPHCSQSWESRIQSDKFCNALHSSLFEQCSAKVDPEYYFNACKLDMCECPGDQCHCEVLTAYARECERAGQLVHGWREATNCKNVTSYAYKRRNNRRNQLRLAGLESNNVELLKMPEWKSKSKDLGQFLPGCSPKTSHFCGRPQSDQGVTFNRLEKRNMKHKLTRSQRRKLRRQRKKERQRRKRKQRRQRRRRQRRLRSKSRRKQVNNRKKELERLGRAGVMVQHVQSGGQVKKRLNWANFKSTNQKVPPFESLLTSLDDLLKSKNESLPDSATDKVAEEEDFEVFADLVTTNTSAIIRNLGEDSPPGGKRVPLPLLEDERLAADSGSSRPKRMAGPLFKNWKHRRRGEDWDVHYKTILYTIPLLHVYLPFPLPLLRYLMVVFWLWYFLLLEVQQATLFYRSFIVIEKILHLVSEIYKYYDYITSTTILSIAIVVL